MENSDFDVVLSGISFLSCNEKVFLRNNLDSLEVLVLQSIEELEKLLDRKIRTRDWDGKKYLEMAKKSISLLKSFGIGVITFDSHLYPALLRETFNPPFVLFYRGNPEVLQKKCVSAVGTRLVCRETAHAAQEFASGAVMDDCCVVSGLAWGIDSFAHRGALRAVDESGSGSTCAVLPCGIDTVVPYSNRPLARRIIEKGGCIISEYMPAVPNDKWRFVQRNRIIAGLSPATVVFQAPPGSGALITADFALDYNRDLFFHRDCFCENSMKLEREAEKRNDMKARGTRENLRCCKKYLDDGAAIISDYAEYREALGSAPGKFCPREEYVQQSLF